MRDYENKISPLTAKQAWLSPEELVEELGEDESDMELDDSYEELVRGFPLQPPSANWTAPPAYPNGLRRRLGGSALDLRHDQMGLIEQLQHLEETPTEIEDEQSSPINQLSGETTTASLSSSSTGLLRKILWGVISKVLLELIVEEMPVPLKGLKEAYEDLRSIYRGNYTPQRMLEQLSDALERLGSKFSAHGDRYSAEYKRITDYLRVVGQWLKSVSHQWTTLEHGIHEFQGNESVLGKVVDLLAMTETLLADPQLKGLIAEENLDNLTRGLRTIQQTLGQVQLWQALPNEVGLTGYLDILSDDPLVLKVLEDSTLRLAKVLAHVREGYPQDGSLTTKMAWLVSTLSNPELRERLQPHLEWMLGGKQQADQLFAITELVGQLRFFPMDSSLGGQALWLLTLLSQNGGDTPALEWVKQLQFALSADSTSLILLQRILTLDQHSHSWTELLRDLAKEVAPSAGLMAARNLADNLLPMEVVQQLEKFYQESTATESWACMCQRMARGVVSLAKPYVAGALMDNPYAAATVRYTEAIQKHTSIEETLKWFVANDLSKDKTLQFLYTQYLNAILVWQVYQAFSSHDPLETEAQLRQLARQLKDYQVVKSYPQLEKLIDLIPLLPALREARDSVGVQPAAETWLGWAEQWLDALASSNSPSLLELRNHLSRAVEKWVAEAALSAFNALPKLLPGAEAASTSEFSRERLTTETTASVSAAAAPSFFSANWRVGAGVSMELIGLTAIAYGVWQVCQARRAEPPIQDTEMQLLGPSSAQTQQSAQMGERRPLQVLASERARDALPHNNSPSRTNQVLPILLGAVTAGLGTKLLYDWFSRRTPPEAGEISDTEGDEYGLNLDDPKYTQYIHQILAEELKLLKTFSVDSSEQATLEEEYLATNLELSDIDIPSLLGQEVQAFDADVTASISFRATEALKHGLEKREVDGARATPAPFSLAPLKRARARLDFSKYDADISNKLITLWDQVASLTNNFGDDDEITLRYLMRYQARLINELKSQSELLDSDPEHPHRFSIARWMAGLIAQIEQVKKEVPETRFNLEFHNHYQMLVYETIFKNVQRSFNIADLEDPKSDTYVEQWRAWWSSAASAPTSTPLVHMDAYLRQPGLTNTQSLSRLAIATQSHLFDKKLDEASKSSEFDALPQRIQDIYKKDILEIGVTIYNICKKLEGVEGRSELDMLALQIEYWQQRKQHMANLFLQEMTIYGINRFILSKYGNLYGKYSGDRAVFEAKKIAVEMVTEKYGVDLLATTSSGDERLTTTPSRVAEPESLTNDEKIIAFHHIIGNPQSSDEIKAYLYQAAVLTYHKITKNSEGADYSRLTGAVIANFKAAQASSEYFKRFFDDTPAGYRGLNTFKKSGASNTWAEYYRQFIDYKEHSINFDAKTISYSTLIGLGLTDYDLSQMAPERVVYGNLQVFFNADPEIKARGNRQGGGKFMEFLGPVTQVPGMIGFIPLKDGRILAISGLSMNIAAKIFEKSAVDASPTLSMIRDSASLPDSPAMEGSRLVYDLLRPLLGSDTDKIITKEYQPRYSQGLRQITGYPILRAIGRTDRTANICRKTHGVELIPVADAVVKEILKKWVGHLKEAYKDTTFWSVVSQMLPFYSEIHGAVHDPEHRLDANSIMWDIVGVLTALLPGILAIGKLGQTAKAIIKKTILENVKNGLNGKRLTGAVLQSLISNPEFTKLGLKGLAYAAYAGIDAVSPLPPELISIPIMRGSRYLRKLRNKSGELVQVTNTRNFSQNLDALAGLEKAAFDETATISVGPDRTLTLKSSQLTPGELIEESHALSQPVARKQPAVRRAGENAPYKNIEDCIETSNLEGGKRRAKRGLEDLLCVSGPTDEEKLELGDISPLLKEVRIYGAALENSVFPIIFEQYRYDDAVESIGGAASSPTHMERPIQTSLGDPETENSPLGDFVRSTTGDNIYGRKGRPLFGKHVRVIDVLNANAGTNALKIPLNMVTESHPIFAFSGPLSGCTMIYAVRGSDFYIYHAGVTEDAVGKPRGWKTGREGINSIAQSHAKLSREPLPGISDYNYNSLLDIFSGYDRVFIAYSGKLDNVIIGERPNIHHFNYSPTHGSFKYANMANSNALLTRRGSRVSIQVLGTDIGLPIKPGKSAGYSLDHAKILNHKIADFGEFPV